MNFLRDCLCVVLLSVSIQGYNFSFNHWTMTGADNVSAVEGAAAVLPCIFTHPHKGKTLTGTVMWMKWKKSKDHLVFNCTYPNPGLSQCHLATQKAGGGRFLFVGNLSQRDASVMVDRLSLEDEGLYRCRVELNIGKFYTMVLTNLMVRAPDGKGSVVNGTEGASVTLPCMFERPPSDLIPHTVTWMVKDPYQHVVTFRPQSDGSWLAESSATRYELVGDLKQGNAATRINQLSVQDGHDYLCVVEFHKPDNFQYSGKFPYLTKTPFIHQFQCEARLLVTPVSLKPAFIYLPVILVLLITLCVILLIFRKKVNSCLMMCMTGSKREAPGSTSPGGREAKKQQSASGDNGSTYGNLGTNRETGDNGSTYDNLMINGKTGNNGSIYDNMVTNGERDTCTYASLVIDGAKAQTPEAHGAGGPKIGASASQEDTCTYASLVIDGGKSQTPEAHGADVIYAVVEMNQ